MGEVIEHVCGGCYGPDAAEADVEDVVDVLARSAAAPMRGGEKIRGPRPVANDPLLTVGEVAATMRVSNMTVYRQIKSGQLAAIRVGKNYRIYESVVAAYLAERAVRVDGA